MKQRKWNLEQLKEAVKNNKSIRGVLIELGLAPKGGNFATIKKAIEQNNIDSSHFTGQLWNKGGHQVCNPALPLADILKEGIEYQSFKLKKRLIEAQIKEKKCECCGNIVWLNKPIPLELHHIDGNHKNNKLENLQLLCPNCHALTENYRGKNKMVG